MGNTSHCRDKMDHANAVLCGEEEPTVDDFIEWVEEEAVRMGMIGFRTEYASLEEIFADVSMKTGSVKEFEEIDSLEDCATVEMLRIHQDIDMMERRMKIMKANPLLLARAEVQVDKKLLAAGKLQEDIASYPKGRNGLRVKVMDLHALNHPIAPVTGPPRGISALVVLGEKLDRRIPVTLPVKATLAEVCKLLDGTCASEDYLTKGWHQAPTDKRIWKYRFIAGGEKSRDLSSSTRLFTDADYQHLIQQATEKNKGQNSQLVVLILVSRLHQRLWVSLNHTLGRATRNKTSRRKRTPQE